MKVRITYNDTKFKNGDKDFINKFIKLLQDNFPLKDDVTIMFLGKQIGGMSTGSRNDKSELKHIHIEPEEGMLIFFPAYVVHEVQTNKSNDLRISLSTDIIQKIDRNAPYAMVLKSWTNSFLKMRENV